MALCTCAPGTAAPANGWLGNVIKLHQARIRVPGLETDVTIIDLGTGPPALRSKVDAAYRAKYSVGYESMVSDDAAEATTLGFNPAVSGTVQLTVFLA